MASVDVAQMAGDLRENAKCELIGDTPVMVQLKRQIRSLGQKDCDVLIQGESGVGKELVARRLHLHSPRRDRPFLAINCAAIADSILESQLFGHEAGSFTGATESRQGIFRAAHGGTLLLDEVGDMSLPMQAKLLRVCEERAVLPVGGDRPVPVDVRIVAATNRNMTEDLREGRFRHDLYYRLAVVVLEVQPLRERLDDLPLLVRHFCRRFAASYRQPLHHFSAEAMDLLRRHSWPGNVREVANLVERTYALDAGPAVTQDFLRSQLTGLAESGPARNGPLPSWEEAERDLVYRALEHAGGSVVKAARLLQMNRNRLARKIAKYIGSD